MKQKFAKTLLRIIFLLCICSDATKAQKSFLVNLGNNTCADPLSPAFAIINDPLNNPSVLNNCDLINQLPDYNNTFIAYNPKDNKIYINDVRHTDSSKIWIMDVGLPNNIDCPASIPLEPNLFLAYPTNNFEFDNKGNLWSLKFYNSATGLCTMDRYDILTGNVLASKTLQFPGGNFPTDIGNGDLCILPNGRFFVTFGRSPSRFYEITNYDGGAGNAIATYLYTMPNDCFGIAYLNGKLEITGTNSTNLCYYFDYDIGSGILGTQKIFQNGLAPIDNSSFSPVVGATKKLTGVTKITDDIYDLTYEIYVQNLGNVILNNINVTENLENVFGAGNVSNVSANFIAGFNTPGLALNNSFNGTTITNLLAPNQTLVNKTSDGENYFFKLKVSFRASNLLPNVTYYNSAIATANINSNIVGQIDITDSSNNGTPAVVDPNMNGIANEFGENYPTPFLINILPVKFIYNHATNKDNNAIIDWKIATPILNGNKFIIEYSKDGKQWLQAGEVPIINSNQGLYQFTHQSSSFEKVFYRIKEVDKDGISIYSTIMKTGSTTDNNVDIYPNPANNFIQITTDNNISKTQIELYDAVGKKLLVQSLIGGTVSINTTNLPRGVYIVKLQNNENSSIQRVLVAH